MDSFSGYYNPAYNPYMCCNSASNLTMVIEGVESDIVRYTVRVEKT